MGAYLKLFIAAAGAAAVTLHSALTGDDNITTGEWVQVGVSWTAAALVGIVANPQLPLWRHTKAVVMAIHAALAGILAEMANGGGELSKGGWINVGILALTAAGVWTFANKATPASGAPIE